MLKAAIIDEVYARFSERMLQMGMLGFMVDFEERWQANVRNRRRLVKTVGFGVKSQY